MITALKRIIKSGYINFKRQGGLTFATVSIMIMTLSLVAFLYLFQGMINFLVQDLQDRIDVSVYFKKDSLEEEIFGVKDEISKIQEVKSVEYVSREEALNSFTEKHKDDPVLMESLAEIGSNPLLASLNIKTWQVSQYESLSNFLENASFKNLIDKIDYRQNKIIIEKIFNVSSNIRLTGIIFSIILGLVAVIVAFNTIKLSIYHSKEEIAIMRLVGASNWFIRGPFLVQGIIVGIVATLATIVLFGIIILFLNSRFESIMPGFGLSIYFLTNFWNIIFIQLATGIGLSIISSIIAIRKYLEV